MTFLRNSNADTYSFRVNLFSRADRNPFFVLSLLPPQPTHHPESPGKHYRNKNCNLPVLNKKSFCQRVTRILLLQIDLPAAGFFTSPALQKPTSAVLQASCRESTPPQGLRQESALALKSPLLLRPGQRWASTWKSWVARKFGTVLSHLWSLILCKSSIF